MFNLYYSIKKINIYLLIIILNEKKKNSFIFCKKKRINKLKIVFQVQVFSLIIILWYSHNLYKIKQNFYSFKIKALQY